MYCLQGFTHPALVAHSTIWDVRSIPKLKDFLFAVSDDNNKQLVASVIDAYITQVEPLYPQFSKGTCLSYSVPSNSLKMSGIKA